MCILILNLQRLGDWENILYLLRIFNSFKVQDTVFLRKLITVLILPLDWLLKIALN